MPDPRSVQEVVDAVAESLARAGRSDKDWEWLLPSVRAHRCAQYRERLADTPVPAMVEVLVFYGDRANYREGCPGREGHRLPNGAYEWICDNSSRARAVLGGEVQGRPDRPDVAGALEHVWAAREALRRAQTAHNRVYADGFAREADGSLKAAETLLNGPPASTSNDRGDER